MKQKKTAQSQTNCEIEINDQIKKTSEMNSVLINEISMLQNKILRNHEILSALLPKPNTLLLEIETETNKYYSLLEEKSQLQTQSNQSLQALTSFPIEIEAMRNENIQLKKALENKIIQIEKLQKTIIKERKKGAFKEACEEIYVISPTPQALSSLDIIPSVKKDKSQKNNNNNSNSEYERQIQILQIAIMSIENEIEKTKLNENDATFNNSIKNMNNSSFSERSRHMVRNTNETDELFNNDNDENVVTLNIQSDRNDVNYDCDKANSNSQCETFSINEEIEKMKNEKKRLEKIDLRYKEEIIDYKTNYEKMKSEIHRLTKIIKDKSDLKHNNHSTIVLNH